MTQQLRPAPTSDLGSHTPRRPLPRCPRPHCGGNMIAKRDGDYVMSSCLACGRRVNEQYRPTTLAYEVKLPPRAFEAPPTRANKPRPKPTLDVPEPELTKLVGRYCDLRQRGCTQKAIRAKTNWPRHYPSLLLEEARQREIPVGLVSQAHAFDTWLLTVHDAGTDLRSIQRMSGQTPAKTKRKLTQALDNASQSPDALIIRGPDGSPGRVSWTTADGHLAHRAFDGPFPRGYPISDAIDQCREVLIRLTAIGNAHARNRTFTMLLMAEAGLHTLDHRAGKEIYNVLHGAGLNDDAKRTVLLKLHDNREVGLLLLDRCGVSPRWLVGNRARFLSRRLREHGFSPAVVRTIVEHMGHNPNTYYNIGAEHRIPRPTPDTLEQCANALRQAGADDRRIDDALSTLGVPPSGHWPPRHHQATAHTAPVCRLKDAG